jgi:hypothetical protein
MEVTVALAVGFCSMAPLFGGVLFEGVVHTVQLVAWRGRTEQGATPRGQSSKINGLRRSHRLALPPAGRRIEYPVTWRGRSSRINGLR